MYIYVAVLHVIFNKNHVYAYHVLTILFLFTDSKESMISCWTNAIARFGIVKKETSLLEILSTNTINYNKKVFKIVEQTDL